MRKKKKSRPVQTSAFLPDTLRKPNTPIPLEQWQVDEIFKCAEDPEYFFGHYVKVVTIDKGIQFFELRPYQKKTLKQILDERYMICLWARQSGKSTLILSFILWLILFHPHKAALIVANKAQVAQKLLEQMKLSYEELPIWMQHGVLRWAETKIKLENGSSVTALGTSKTAGRSGTYAFVFADEVAHIDKNKFDDFYAAINPTISSGESSKLVLVTTPKGYNFFHDMWQRAIKKISTFAHSKVIWSDIPGRDERWKEIEIRNSSPEKFAQEYECSFLGSSETLISTATVEWLAKNYQQPIFESEGGKLRIWENPIRYNKAEPKSETNRNHFYVLAFDCGEGLIQDYSAFSVVDVTEIPYKVVARYRSNAVSPILFPHDIVQVARQYNDAMLWAETDSVGGQTLDLCYRDLEYTNAFCTMTIRGRRGGQKLMGNLGQTSKLGIKMSAQVKAVGCANFKTLVESQKLIIPDHDTVSEISTFVADGSSFSAEEGCHDDLVMGLVNFSWLITQQYFKDWTDGNIRERLYIEQQQMIEDQQLPYPIFEDDTEENMLFVDDSGQVWEYVDERDAAQAQFLGELENDRWY